MLADARARWQARVDTYQHTMTVQSHIVSDIPADEAELSALVGQSQGAAGALQAIQSSNQLLALQSRQLSATQDLLSACGTRRSHRCHASCRGRECSAGRVAALLWQRCQLYSDSCASVRRISAMKVGIIARCDRCHCQRRTSRRLGTERRRSPQRPCAAAKRARSLQADGHGLERRCALQDRACCRAEAVLRER